MSYTGSTFLFVQCPLVLDPVISDLTQHNTTFLCPCLVNTEDTYILPTGNYTYHRKGNFKLKCKYTALIPATLVFKSPQPQLLRLTCDERSATQNYSNIQKLGTAIGDIRANGFW